MTPIEIEVTRTDADWVDSMRSDLRSGLTRDLKEIPPKYFYDDVGSALFDEITHLPEYYLTRAETALLTQVLPSLIARVRPEELLELGSGYSTKTRLLLDAMASTGNLQRYLAVDVSEGALREALTRITRDYPLLFVRAVVGDFTRDLHRLPREGRRLVAFLGSTIGNFCPREAVELLQHVADNLGPEDRFLLGADLVKEQAVLHAAYNDAAGVTARFNRNVLQVVNRVLGATFDPEAFDHVAFFDPANSWIEMRLRARHALSVSIPGLSVGPLDPAFLLDLRKGEEIRTEISCKYTRGDIERLFRAAGLALLEWHTDADQTFALALAGHDG